VLSDELVSLGTVLAGCSGVGDPKTKNVARYDKTFMTI